MGLPTIDIAFKSAVAETIRRSANGIVAVIVRDNEALAGGYALADVGDVESVKKVVGENTVMLTESNRAYVNRAFMGYVNAPSKVELYVLPSDAEDFSSAMAYFATHPYNFLAAPPDVTTAECQALIAWAKTQRTVNYNSGKLVLPHVAADDELVINFTTDGNVAGSQTFSAAEYCSRVAGLIAGTPLTLSCTSAPLSELSDTTRIPKTAADAAINRGEFIFVHDGEKVVVGRGVNSLTTLDGKSADLQKIKVVEIRDLISNDIRRTIRDNWIGKYGNSYDDKCLLMVAIRNYLTDLVTDGLLVRSSVSVDIDMDKQKAYLRDVQGVDVSTMSEQDIREANTGSCVFLAITIKILDAIEDVYILVEM